MKCKSFLLPLSVLTLLILSADSTRSQTVVTFDDLRETGSGSFIPNGYQGLVWSNCVARNAILFTDFPGVGTSGYYYGMVSASNVALDAFGNTVEIDSPAKFNFLSVYLTGAWDSNLNIEVQGFSGTTSLYDTTVVASATSPTLFTFNYLNIDRLDFSSSGGQNAGFPLGSGVDFAIDNFSFEFVPEPSSLLLATAAALLLCPLLKRKRA